MRALPLVIVVLVSACSDPSTPIRSDAATTDATAGSPDSSFPEPRTDVVPRIGRDATLEVATWNIEHFPKQPGSPRIVADLIASMDLDLVAVQEVEDVAAFDELVERLRGYDGLLSSHSYGNGTYQKIGYIFRRDLITLSAGTLLFDDSGYEFPRPPLQVQVAVDDGTGSPLTFAAITLHLKAGFDAEDRQRRRDAVVILEAHVRQVVDGSGDEDVIILGDFNADVTSDSGAAVFGPFLTAADRYDLRTEALASDGDATFLPSGVVLDHIVTSAALRDELAAGSVEVPPLDTQIGGYESAVSDHLPVIVQMPLQR